VYGRYDWLEGGAFTDTNRAVTVNGVLVTGITRSTPKEHDYVIGWQHLYDQNIKLVAEYRNHVFDDAAAGVPIVTLGAGAITPAQLKDNGFTLRVMFGF